MTYLFNVFTKNPRYFNPHSRVGSDLDNINAQTLITNFNPHSRVGSDVTVASEFSPNFYFNPHSRVGSDKEDEVDNDKIEISIHTPA